MSTLARRRYYKRRSKYYRQVGPAYMNFYPQAKKERKYVTLSLPGIFPSLTTTWHEGSLSAYVADGTDAINDRVGNRIHIHSLTIKGLLQQGATAGSFDDLYNTVRLCVVLMNRIGSNTPFGGVPVAMNVPLTPGATVLPIVKVIEDMYISLVPSGTASTGFIPATRSINKTYRFSPPITIDYMGTGINTDARMLHMALLSDSGAAPSPGFIAGFVQFGYTD